MQLVQDRNTPMMIATLIPVLLKANQVVHAGALVCIDAAGFAVRGAGTAGLLYAGRADGRASSMNAADGERTVMVRRGAAFKWANDGTVTAAHLLRPVFVLDDQTVAAAGEVQVGIVVRLDNDGVWVE